MSSSRKFLRTIMVVVLTVCLAPTVAFAQEETVSTASEGASDCSEGVGAFGVESEMKAIPAAQNTFDISKEDAIAKGKEAVADKLTGTIVKEIYVPKKIINIVQK